MDKIPLFCPLHLHILNKITTFAARFVPKKYYYDKTYSNRKPEKSERHWFR